MRADRQSAMESSPLRSRRWIAAWIGPPSSTPLSWLQSFRISTLLHTEDVEVARIEWQRVVRVVFPHLRSFHSDASHGSTSMHARNSLKVFDSTSYRRSGELERLRSTSASYEPSWRTPLMVKRRRPIHATSCPAHEVLADPDQADMLGHLQVERLGVEAELLCVRMGSEGRPPDARSRPWDARDRDLGSAHGPWPVAPVGREGA